MADKTDTTEKDADISAEVRDFFQEREGAESDNREGMTEDLRFCYVPGAQWDENARNKRIGRPCYSYNRTVGAVNQVIGDQRQAKPSGKVRAVNKKASKEVAETFSGLIRNIEAASEAETIYDEAFKYAVAGAWGNWRIVPVYADDDSFDQELRIRRIANPQTVYFDENADPFGRRSLRCVVAERISKDKYKALYKDDDPATNVPVSRDSQGWFADDEVRIAEYYKMQCREKEIVLLSDGRTMDSGDELDAELQRYKDAGLGDLTIERKRKVKVWYCTWWKVDGKKVLEGPIDYDYQHIPVIRLPGRHVNIEGEQYLQGLIRHSKDAQRTYNYHRSTMVETVALTPKAPWLVTAKMIKGREAQWGQANAAVRPYLVYDPDDKVNGGRPYREPPPDVPQALTALAAQDAEDIKQTTGYIGPHVDQADGQPESGRARRYRMLSSDSGSYEFLDNFGKAVQYTWQVLIDMIPVHYDSERVVRILGLDGKEDHVTINGEDEDGVIRRLKGGKYDVKVTLGPAYATQRAESRETLLDAAEKMPIIAEVAPDIIVRNMDVDGAEEIEKRIRRRLIMSGQVEPTDEEREGLPETEPDPTQQALAQRLAAESAYDQARATKTNIESAEAMAKANTAERREGLELEQMVREIAHQQAETMLLIKKFLNEDPGKKSTTVSL